MEGQPPFDGADTALVVAAFTRYSEALPKLLAAEIALLKYHDFRVHWVGHVYDTLFMMHFHMNVYCEVFIEVVPSQQQAVQAQCDVLNREMALALSKYRELTSMV